jgi:hypothetical protein
MRPIKCDHCGFERYDEHNYPGHSYCGCVDAQLEHLRERRASHIRYEKSSLEVCATLHKQLDDRERDLLEIKNATDPALKQIWKMLP